MPNNHKPDANIRRGTINNQWFRNAIKSMASVSTDVIKDMMPAATGTTLNITSFTSDVTKQLRTGKANMARIQNALKNTQAVKSANDFFKNAIRDLKTGDFYEERQGSAGGFKDEFESGMDTAFGDLDEMFEDVDDVNVETNVVQSDNAATVQAIQKQSDYAVRTAKAQMDFSMAATSATLMRTSEIGNKVISELGSINSNLAALVEYQNANMTKFIDASIAFYDSVSSKNQPNAATPARMDPISIFGFNGELDVKSYFEYIKGTAKEYVENHEILGPAKMLIEMGDEIFTNPMKTISKMVIEEMIPSTIKSTMTVLDESVKDFIPVFLERVAEWGDSGGNGFVGSEIKRAISNIFGVRTKREDQLDFSKIEKGPVPYNGFANHTITDIIPKYLREGNSYLREIVSMLGASPYFSDYAKSESDIERSQQVFNWDTGRFQTMDELRNAFIKQLNDDITTIFSQSTAGQKLANRKSLLTNDIDRDNYDNALEQLYLAIENNEGSINFKDRNVREQLIARLTTTRTNKNLIRESLEQMVEDNDPALLNLSASKIRASQARNQRLSDITNNPNARTAFSGYSVDDFDQLQSEYAKRGFVNGEGAYESQTFTHEQLRDFDTSERGMFANVIGRFGNVLTGIMHGNSDAALQSMFDGIGGMFLKAGDTLGEKFFAPVSEFLFGKTGEDEEASEGLITQVKSRLKSVGNYLVDSIKVKFFEDKDADESEGPSIMDRAKGLVEKGSSFIYKGFTGWGRALFGDKFDEKFNSDGTISDEDIGKSIVSGIKEKVGKGLPDFITGGLLGSIVGGPVFGAFTGFATSLVRNSDSFQKWLFGPEIVDEEGNATGERSGGIISKNVQDYMRKNGKFLTGSALVGGVSGLLGFVTGGPVVGSLMGLANGIIWKSDAFQTMLFGKEDEEGNRNGGLKKYFSDLIGNFSKEHGLGGMSVIGTAGGGLIGALMGGPIAGAALGLGASIIAQKKNFHDWFFGSEDENGNKKEGVLGKFRNMLSVNVFQPMKNTFLDISDNIRDFVKYDILGKGAIMIKDVGTRLVTGVLGITHSASEMIGSLGDTIKEKFLHNFIDGLGNIFSPLTSAVGTVAKAAVGVAKTVISAPINILYAITSPLATAVGKMVGGAFKVAGAAINTFIIKPVSNLVIKPLGFIVETAGKLIAAPFKLVNNLVSTVTTKISDGVSQVSRFVTSVIIDAKQWVKDKVITPFISPVFKFIKGVGKDIRDRILQPFKDAANYTLGAVKGFFKGGWNLLKTIGGTVFSGIGRLFSLGRDKSKDRDNGPTGNEPYLLRKWREARNGTIQTNSTNERDQLTVDTMNASTQREQASRDRRQYTKNSRQIYKATGGQRIEDTEENRKLAEMMVGHSLHWGDVKAKVSPEIEVAQEGNEISRSINERVDAIFTFLTGKKFESAKKTADDAKAARSKAQSDSDNASGPIGKTLAKFGLHKANRQADNAIRDAGEARVTDAFNNVSNFIKKLHFFAGGTEDAKRGAAIVGEAGLEIETDANGKQVAVYNSPTLTNVKGGNKIHNTSEIQDAAQATVSDRTNEVVHAEAEAEKEKAAQLLREESKIEALQNIEKNQREYTLSWNSIFSKKGLLTAGILMVAPKILSFLTGPIGKGISGIIGALSGGFKGISEYYNEKISPWIHEKAIPWVTQTAWPWLKEKGEMIWNGILGIKDTVVDWWNGAKQRTEFSNKNLGDGKTIQDKLNDEMDRTKRIGSDIANFKYGTAIKDFVYNEDGKIDAQSGSRAKLVARAGATVAASTSNMITAAGKALSKGISENKASAKVIAWALTCFQSFIKGIGQKLGKKGSQVAAKILSKLSPTVSDCLSKAGAKVSARLSAIMGGTAALAATGVGLLAKETTWVVLGAINGTTGAKRLFKTDQTDGTMVLISTALGAFKGTTIGMVADVINELVATTTGLDVFSEIANLAYRILAGNEKADSLEASQREFQNQYNADIDENLRQQYEEMVAAGTIDPKVVGLQAFINGAKNCEFDAKIQSFEDYNAEKHQTLGSRALKVAKVAVGGVANIVTAPFKFVENGLTAVKNGLINYTAKGTSANENVYNIKTAPEMLKNDPRIFSSKSNTQLRTSNGSPSLSLQERQLGVNLDYLNESKTMNANIKNINEILTKYVDSTKKTQPISSSSYYYQNHNVFGGFGEYQNGVPYYSQNDNNIANKAYGDSTYGMTGCGPAAMTSIVNDLTNGKATPETIGRYAEVKGYRDNTGTNWNFVDDTAGLYGLKSHRIVSPSSENIRELLASGRPIMMSGRSDSDGIYTEAGHYIVGTGVNGNKLIFNDPRGRKYSGSIDINQAAKDTNAIWGFDLGGSGYLSKEKNNNGGYGQSEFLTFVGTPMYKNWIDSVKSDIASYNTMLSTPSSPIITTPSITEYYNNKHKNFAKTPSTLMLGGGQDANNALMMYFKLIDDKAIDINKPISVDDFMQVMARKSYDYSTMSKLVKDYTSASNNWTGNRGTSFVNYAHYYTNRNVQPHATTKTSNTSNTTTSTTSASTTSTSFTTNSSIYTNDVEASLPKNTGTGVTINDIIQIAKNEVGYVAKKSNDQLDNPQANEDGRTNRYNKYGRDLGKAFDTGSFPTNAHWCVEFVNWVIFMATNEDKEATKKIVYGYPTASTSSELSRYKKNNQYTETNPQPGDIAFIATRGGNTPSHVGLVIEVDGNKVTTIEGNTTNEGHNSCVAIKNRPNSQLIGFGRPMYDTNSKFNPKGFVEKVKNKAGTFLDTIGRIGSGITKLGTALLTGLLTGNLSNINWRDVFYGDEEQEESEFENDYNASIASQTLYDEFGNYISRSSGDANKDTIFKALTDAGLSRNAALGIMANWTLDSGLNSNHFEGRHIAKESTINDIYKDHESANAFFNEILRPAYLSSGEDIDKNLYAYKGIDGTEYMLPGVGLGNWRGKYAYEFAKYINNHGSEMSIANQIGYMLDGPYGLKNSGLLNTLNDASSSEEAAKYYANFYKSSLGSGVVTGAEKQATVLNNLFTTDNSSATASIPEIYNTIRSAGYNANATAGIMGNLMAESGINSKNLQNDYENKLGFTDDSYTQAVDNGSYDNFVHDNAGYGLAQWTWWTRKQNLLDKAKSMGTSISDANMQTAFLLDELKEKGYLNRLNSAGSIKAASNIILHDFEKPDNQSAAVENKRYEFSQDIYNQMGGAGEGNSSIQGSTVDNKRYKFSQNTHNQDGSDTRSSTINNKQYQFSKNIYNQLSRTKKGSSDTHDSAVDNKRYGLIQNTHNQINRTRKDSSNIQDFTIDNKQYGFNDYIYNQGGSGIQSSNIDNKQYRLNQNTHNQMGGAGEGNSSIQGSTVDNKRYEFNKDINNQLGRTKKDDSDIQNVSISNRRYVSRPTTPNVKRQIIRSSINTSISNKNIRSSGYGTSNGSTILPYDDTRLIGIISQAIKELQSINKNTSNLYIPTDIRTAPSSSVSSVNVSSTATNTRKPPSGMSYNESMARKIAFDTV